MASDPLVNMIATRTEWRRTKRAAGDSLVPDRALLGPKVPAEDDSDGEVDDHAKHPVRLERILAEAEYQRASGMIT